MTHTHTHQIWIKSLFLFQYIATYFFSDLYNKVIKSGMSHIYNNSTSICYMQTEEKNSPNVALLFADRLLMSFV
jgi:hypothetical protein